MSFAFRFEDLGLAWKNTPVLDSLHGEIKQGELLAILGPNGAGKSTLLKAMMDLISPAHGKVVKNPALSYALLPQSSEIDKHFPMTVYDLVAMGAWREVGIFKKYSAEVKARIDHAIRRVGLAKYSQAMIGELSGGQFQRALFARMMVTNAQVFLLDEPFAGIDAYTRDDLLCIIRDWHTEGRTVIAVLHDIDIAKTQFAECLLLARGVIAWGPAQEVVCDRHLERAREKGGF